MENTPATSGVRFRIDPAEDDQRRPKALSPADSDYYYASDSGQQPWIYPAPASSTSPRGKKTKPLAPVAEVAPRMSFDIEAYESEEDQKAKLRASKVDVKPKEAIVASERPSTSRMNSTQSRPSTAEIIVALSERRRSLAVAATDASRRKSVPPSGTTKRKSVPPDGDQVDPLRAEVQMLTECFNLIKRNQRQLVLNVFLILLVALILSSMIVFAVLGPSPAAFEITLTPWASFWPLNMRLSLYQLGRSKDSLSMTLGNGKLYTLRAPSYCTCCTDDAPQCDPEYPTDRCWCFKWESQARLYISSVRPLLDDTVNCLILEWRCSSQQQISATDCFRISFDDGVRWYGGPLITDQKWPMNVNVTKSSFSPYLINDVVTDPKGFYGMAEPMWISDNGFAVMASLDNPFLVNRSDIEVCMRSTDLTRVPLRYMVCRADDSRTYTLNLTTLNDYATLAYPEVDHHESPKGTLDKVVGTIFVSYDSSEVTVEGVSKMEQDMIDYKMDFGIAFENFDLLNESMAENVIRSIQEAEKVLVGRASGLPVKAVEVNNFVRFSHLQGPDGRALQGRCVTQSDKNIIGISQWRNDIYACLDFTRSAVADWFNRMCANHVINSVIDYFAFAGGDASTLPMTPNLNLTTAQTNFYSTLYARLAASVPKSFLVDVAYNTHGLSDMYVNMAMSSDNVRSMIPLMLTMSLQGYSRFAFNLVNYSIPAGGWLPTADNTDPLFTWLELAMFTPVFRIPQEIMEWNGFNATVTRFLPFREQILMEHYNAAAKLNSQTGEPIYKSVWWVDYKDFRQGKYSSDQATVWANDRQFMVGDNLMVAAFLQVDGTEHTLYIPPGVWRDIEEQTMVLNGPAFITYGPAKNVACFQRVPA